MHFLFIRKEKIFVVVYLRKWLKGLWLLVENYSLVMNGISQLAIFFKLQRAKCPLSKCMQNKKEPFELNGFKVWSSEIYGRNIWAL